MGFFGEMNSALLVIARVREHISHYCNKTGKKGCNDYYFDEYNRKVFVKKNGSGLIVSAVKLKVVDPEKIDYFNRTLDISDGKKTAAFTDFKQMKEVPLENIFNEYGFWYISQNEIITDAEEYYDDMDKPQADRNNFLGFRLISDNTKLKKGLSYTFSYAISVPDLFPISDGYFDDQMADRKNYESFSSYVSASHFGDLLKFSMYFEQGINFKEKPKGYAYRSDTAKPSIKNIEGKQCEFKDNIFYTKYSFTISEPQEYKSICMKWDIKDKNNLRR